MMASPLHIADFHGGLGQRPLSCPSVGGGEGGGADGGGFAGIAGVGFGGDAGGADGGVTGFGVALKENDESNACMRPLYSSNRDGDVT